MAYTNASSLIPATLVLALAQCGAMVWAQSTVPIGAPERVQEHIPASRFDTRVLRQPVNEQATEQPRQSPRGVQPPDFAAHINNLPAGGLIDAERVQSEEAWPAVGATGWYPPDPDIAVGPNHVLVVVNSTIAWFDKTTGVNKVQQTAGTFFSGVAQTNFVFDPKCFYDRFNDRFVVLFVEEDDAAKISNALVAVSDDSDPNGVWFRYWFDAKLTINNSSYWLDYPGFGYTPGAYVVSGNMFGFTSGFAGVQFLVIPSAPLLSGGDAKAVSLRDPSGASVQMAEVVDSTTSSAFGVSRSGSSALRVYAIQAPQTTTPTGVYAAVTVPSNSSPATDAQSTGGKKLDTIDGRVFNAVWRGNKLVTAHSSTPSTGAPVAVRWYEVDTGNWPVPGAAAPTLVQAGLVSSPDTDYFMPAINKNAAGDISLLFSASSSSITANIMAAGRTQDDPTGTMGQPVVMRVSDGTAYSQGRWGDYFGIDVDPWEDKRFWGVGEYVRDDNSWGTEVVSWNVVSTPALPPVAPTSLTAKASNKISIALSWKDNASNEDGYEIEGSLNNKDWDLIAGTSANARTFTVTGLNSRTTYYYRVRAYNAAGKSAYSNTASAKTR